MRFFFTWAMILMTLTMVDTNASVEQKEVVKQMLRCLHENEEFWEYRNKIIDLGPEPFYVDAVDLECVDCIVDYSDYKAFEDDPDIIDL